MGSASNYPRDPVRVLTKHRTVLITRLSPGKAIVACTICTCPANDSRSTQEGGPSQPTRARRIEVVVGVVDELIDELDDNLAHLNNFGVMWGFGLDACMHEGR